jgi:hypothetical protein
MRRPDLNDALAWRLCAEEMRCMAELLHHEKCRAMALRIADGYDRLAQRAEDRVMRSATSGVPT